jgi:hypothetical protein
MIGKAHSRQVLTDVRRDCGQRSTGPSVVFDQSSSRIRRAISELPGKISFITGLESEQKSIRPAAAAAAELILADST